MALLGTYQILLTSVRFIRHKPWIPKFRLIRQMQPWVQPFDPDLISIGGKSGTERATSSEIREHLRRNGLMPPLLFQEHRINLTHSGRIFDEYVPPEGDGKSSLLSTGVISDAKDSVVKKAKTARAALRIRKHKPAFSTSTFPLEADAIYKEVHTLLPKFYANQERILELTTEKAFVEMTEGLKLRTLHWKFTGSLEPPRVVSCRIEEAMGKGNMFGQVTVRFHTQQRVELVFQLGENDPISSFVISEARVTPCLSFENKGSSIGSPTSALPHNSGIPSSSMDPFVRDPGACDAQANPAGVNYHMDLTMPSQAKVDDALLSISDLNLTDPSTSQLPATDSRLMGMVGLSKVKQGCMEEPKALHSNGGLCLSTSQILPTDSRPVDPTTSSKLQNEKVDDPLHSLFESLSEPLAFQLSNLPNKPMSPNVVRCNIESDKVLPSISDLGLTEKSASQDPGVCPKPTSSQICRDNVECDADLPSISDLNLTNPSTSQTPLFPQNIHGNIIVGTSAANANEDCIPSFLEDEPEVCGVREVQRCDDASYVPVPSGRKHQWYTCGRNIICCHLRNERPGSAPWYLDCTRVAIGGCHGCCKLRPKLIPPQGKRETSCNR
uniref:Large ribosomal subunit protein mL45 n=1 Tax=Echinococcus canadensis TaxID=519352 RepID=A0A915EZ30_9CEST